MTTSAEKNGEVQRGYDYARFVATIIDPGVVLDTTWLDCPYGNDASANPDAWRPVHYLAYLAARNPHHLRLYGENTGRARPRCSSSPPPRPGSTGLPASSGSTSKSSSRASVPPSAPTRP